MKKTSSTTTTFDEQMGTHFFARYPGPGTRMYPSPAPRDDVPDLTLPAMRWIEIHPAFAKSAGFARDKTANVFEWAEGTVQPADIDFSTPEDLTPQQRELVRLIVLDTGELLPQYVSAISIANQVGGDGRPLGQNVAVTVAYLKSTHAPFLRALAEVEGRYQKREKLLEIIGKQLARIEHLPGGE
jgi:hypothetical protein